MYNLFLLDKNVDWKSSLGRKLAPFVKGKKIFFKGKINVGYVMECLLGIQKVDKIILVTGNDIFPSKMCMGHKCLEPCNIDEVTRSFNDLLDVLFQYTNEVRIVEPPPRCKRIAGHPNCTFWEDIESEDRFKVLISRLKNIRSRNEEILGVVSNKYLMRAINGHTIWSLTGSDLTHFSKPALIKLSKLLG